MKKPSKGGFFIPTLWFILNSVPKGKFYKKFDTGKLDKETDKEDEELTEIFF